MLYLVGAIVALVIVVLAVVAIGTMAMVFGLLALGSVIIFFGSGFLASAIFGDEAMAPAGMIAVLLSWLIFGAYWAAKDRHDEKG